MPKAKLKWTGGRAARSVKARLGANLHPACKVVVDEWRGLISTQGPPRSLPGDPPHIDSRRLIDSLYDEVDRSGLAARIGSTEEHAPYLEIGTSTMAARPSLLPACLNAADGAARRLAK